MFFLLTRRGKDRKPGKEGQEKGRGGGRTCYEIYLATLTRQVDNKNSIGGDGFLGVLKVSGGGKIGYVNE